MKISACLLVFLVLLSACASQPTSTNKSQPLAPEESSAASVLRLSKLSDPFKTQSVINDGFNAIGQDDWAQAMQLLNITHLNPANQEFHHQLIELASILALHDTTAESSLNWLRLNNQLSETQAIVTTGVMTSANLRLNALLQLQNGDIDEALISALNLSQISQHPLLDAELIWQILKLSSHKQRNQASQLYLADETPLGWLELMAVFKNLDTGVNTQRQALMKWQNQWPNHIANTAIANDIAQLSSSPDETSATIAVAIPTSGKLAHIGSALRDGLLAAHSSSEIFSRVHFIDTAVASTPEALLEAINQVEAQIVIGPIDKALAAGLANLAERTQTMISLNQIDNIDSSNPNLVFALSLAIEDEAEYIAADNFEQYDHPLLIATSHPLATRSMSAYQSTWHHKTTELRTPELNTSELPTAEQQTIVDTNKAISYVSMPSQDNYSDEIKTALLLNESYQRLRKLEDTFIERMENNLRRRQDISHIFIAATPSQARAIHPLLAYHFAGDLPVYSTSLLFDGAVKSNKNRDLNDIIFADTPWAVAKPTALKTSISLHIENGGTSSKNLHGLAIDAYHLASLVARDLAHEAFTFEGVTGSYLFSKAAPGKREPALARIKNGAVELVE